MAIAEEGESMMKESKVRKDAVASTFWTKKKEGPD